MTLAKWKKFWRYVRRRDGKYRQTETVGNVMWLANSDNKIAAEMSSNVASDAVRGAVRLLTILTPARV